MRILGLLGLCVALRVSATPQPILRVSRAAASCIAALDLSSNGESTKTFLALSLEQIATGKPLAVEVGLLEDLPQILRRAGVDTWTAKLLETELLESIRDPVDPQGVMGNLASRILKPFLLCVLSEKCRMKPGAAFATYLGRPPFHIVPFEGPSSGYGWKTLETYEDIWPLLDVVATSAPRKLDPPRWIYFAMRELIHMADMQLIREWIAASATLRKLDQPLDELFLKYTRWKGGEIEVDEGFVRVFLDGRAHLGLTLARAVPLPAGPQADYAMEKIRDYGPSVVGGVIKEWNLSARNVLQVTDGWGKIMMQTVQRSKNE